MNTRQIAKFRQRGFVSRTIASYPDRIVKGKEIHSLASVIAEGNVSGGALTACYTTEITPETGRRLGERQDKFPPDRLLDRIDPYNDMIRAHRGRIAHTFDSHCRCACGVEEHDDEECRMRAGIYVWICRRCGMYRREY